MNARCLQRGPRRVAAQLAGLLLVPAAPGAPLDDAPADDAVATRVQAYLEARAAGLDGLRHAEGEGDDRSGRELEGGLLEQRAAVRGRAQLSRL